MIYALAIFALFGWGGSDGIGDATRIREHHGLTAVRERLSLLYGSAATFNISASEPHGITATIEVSRHERASGHR